MYIENISSPKDIKELSVQQLNVLAEEIRTALIRKLSEHGGHIGPNLGMVETTIALHYVFNSPIDKIVFDVSHQSYVHKMLTGRMAAFLDPAKYDDVTGYTNPDESEHDFFIEHICSRWHNYCQILFLCPSLNTCSCYPVCVIPHYSVKQIQSLKRFVLFFCFFSKKHFINRQDCIHRYRTHQCF